MVSFDSSHSDIYRMCAILKRDLNFCCRELTYWESKCEVVKYPGWNYPDDYSFNIQCSNLTYALHCIPLKEQISSLEISLGIWETRRRVVENEISEEIGISILVDLFKRKSILVKKKLNKF